MRIIFAALIGIVVSFGSSAVLAADIAAGKAKTATCTACHGVSGISNNDLWPNLAGQKAGYLAKQIKAFRDGTRKDPLMAPMVAGFSDEDAANVAAYFASLGN